mgnify:FL=1
MHTSGTVVLYSPEGHVEFFGGITLARGHWGDSLGSNMIHAIMGGQFPSRVSPPVYGCEILPASEPPNPAVLANQAQ